MAHLAEPLMTNGGTLFTMTFYGAEKVISHYNVMGPVNSRRAAGIWPRNSAAKAFGSTPSLRVQYKLGRRPSSGSSTALLEKAASEAPAGSLVSTADVGFATAALATYAARLINGNTMYVDGGLHVMW
jgi:enoyl-[acyl-carrier protein] reductase I